MIGANNYGFADILEALRDELAHVADMVARTTASDDSDIDVALHLVAASQRDRERHATRS